ncbi:MAG TPA: hypothetical protein VFO32_06870, partial [Sphingomicrobium sp.]|nr:hypothetical protein [Sphingomicrobium sp.]
MRAGAGDGALFALFETPIGCCAIAWRGRRIIGAGLPETHQGQLRSRMAARFDAAESPPPAFIEEVIRAIVRLLSGERADLSVIDIDLDQAPEFERQVYAAARTIP